MLSFRLFGIPVRVQGIFWLLCVLIGLNYLQQGGSTGIGKFIIFGVSLFITVLWHELGHAWARKKYGAPYSEIVLHGFGGYCAGPGTFTRGQSIFISAAGPLANVILAAVAFALLPLPGMDQMWPRFALVSLIAINLILGILNLLPIFPLDGGQILANLLGSNRRKTVFWIGLILAGSIAVFFLLGKQIFGAIIFGMLAFSNWKGLQGQRPSFP